MKKVIFILQQKEGIGKSHLAYLLAEKYKQATVVDMDAACYCISHHLAYRKPWQISCLNKEGQMNMEELYLFFNQVSKSDSHLFICDTSLAVSSFLKRNLKEHLPKILSLTQSYGIAIEFYIVIGGDVRKRHWDCDDSTTSGTWRSTGDISNLVNAQATLQYAGDIFSSVGHQMPVTVIANEYFAFSSQDKSMAEQFCKERNLPFVVVEEMQPYNGEDLLNKMAKVFYEGKGVDNASGLTAFRLKQAIKKLPILIN